MKHFATLLGAAALGLAMPVLAAGNNTPSGANAPAQLIKTVKEADLANLVRAEGHTVDAMHPFDMPSVRGKTKEGLLFVLMGTACDKNGVVGCQGIMMQVRYDADENVTTERINKATLAQAALGSWWDRDKKVVGFTRYVVLDDGVTWMNIRRNLRVMLSIQEKCRAIVFD